MVPLATPDVSLPQTRVSSFHYKSHLQCFIRCAHSGASHPHSCAIYAFHHYMVSPMDRPKGLHRGHSPLACRTSCSTNSVGGTPPTPRPHAPHGLKPRPGYVRAKAPAVWTAYIGPTGPLPGATAPPRPTCGAWAYGHGRQYACFSTLIINCVPGGMLSPGWDE